MPRIELYTTPSCPFCVRAKRLLAERHILYTEIDVSEDDDLREDVMQRTGRRCYCAASGSARPRSSPAASSSASSS